jgi:DNA helicase-2/ATP-dependent DNA helicase PcrA
VAQAIKLEENYRSGSHILDSANALISHNAKRLGKNLRTAQGPGEPVRVLEAPSDFAEAQWVVDEIRQLVSDGLLRREAAVLYRSNAQSRVLETALFNAGVPYKVYGGLRFFERAEIKHALAYLRLLENPCDDTSFLRVVNFPPRGIGARSLEQLQDAARASGCALSDAVNALSGKAATLLTGFVAGLDVLREQVRGLSLVEVIAATLEHSGLLTHYRADREGEDRVANLEELVSAAESFVAIEGFGRDAQTWPLDEQAGVLTQSPVSQGFAPDLPHAPERVQALVPDASTGETLSPLAAFLTHAALEAGDNQAQAGQDAVQLMSVHASKGLEFDAVFITGLEEGLFPHENAMTDRESLEEERRLMYVAITRARRRLYLCSSQTRMLHGQTRYNPKSRFLDELPPDALKWVATRRPDVAPGWGGSNPQNYSKNRAANAMNTGAYGLFSSNFLAEPVVSAVEQGNGLRVGQRVFHNKFGEGVVLALEGKGADARAHIRFGRHGEKWLALSVAKLTPVP